MFPVAVFAFLLFQFGGGVTVNPVLAAADTAAVDCTNMTPSECLNAIKQQTALNADPDTIYDKAAKLINAALSIVGIVALIYFIYGGYLWMTAGGNEENVTKAKDILRAAAIGMAIILASLAIVTFLVGVLA